MDLNLSKGIKLQFLEVILSDFSKLILLIHIYISSLSHIIVYIRVVIDLICITQYLLIVELYVDLSTSFLLEPLVKVLIFTRNL